MTMRRVNAIWQHPLYQTYYRRLEELFFQITEGAPAPAEG